MVKNGCRTLIQTWCSRWRIERKLFFGCCVCLCIVCHVCPRLYLSFFFLLQPPMGYRYLDVKRLASVRINKLYLYDAAPILSVTSLSSLFILLVAACIVYQSADDTALSSKPCFSICHIRQKPPPSFDNL